MQNYKPSQSVYTLTLTLTLTAGHCEQPGKIGSLSSWIWVDAKVDGKPYVGAMPPVTALAEGE